MPWSNCRTRRWPCRRCTSPWRATSPGHSRSARPPCTPGHSPAPGAALPPLRPLPAQASGPSGCAACRRASASGRHPRGPA
eukprot:12935888-Alexandrium_andersonii.AAC.1